MRSRRALSLTTVGVALVGGAAGLTLGAVAPGGQPVVLALLLALFAGCEYAVLAWRDERREQEVNARQRLREDLVATVSHELRTPLAPIRGWAATLLEAGDRLDDDERRQGLESIVRHSGRLEHLVVNLLEASKIESGRAEAVDTEVDAADVARRVVEEFRAASPTREVHLACALDLPMVIGRELWIEQILSNLLSNALKYAPAGPPIEVSVGNAGDDVEVAVTDHGPGIAADQIERVFDRFERLGQTDGVPGSGLGLYIARQLASELGATLTATSPSDGGSRFVLLLRPAPQLVVLT